MRKPTHHDSNHFVGMLSRPVRLWNLRTGTCEPAELDEDGIPLVEADPLPMDDAGLPDAKGTPVPKSSLVSRFKVSMLGGERERAICLASN